MPSATNADPTEIEFGCSLPPQGPHTITTHMPGWDTATKFRDGDVVDVLKRTKSLYPRFGPFGASAMFVKSLGELVKLPPGYGCAAFLDPRVWAENESHATSEHRREHKVEDLSTLKYYVVEVGGVNFYIIGYPSNKSMSAIFEWQHGGRGISARLSLSMMPLVESATVLGEYPGGKGAPAPTYLKEGLSHGKLRERVAGLMMRACVEDYEKSVAPDDVSLYQTGMAGVRGLHEVIVSMREGPTVVFGAVFHSTYHLFEESPGGMKYYGHSSDAEIDEFEAYLEGGGKCAYLFTEFPSNPVMICVDLLRIRKLADKYGFFLVVDDTTSGFANIDLLSVADVVLSSLTKAFSGYADVMAGSVVLNPNSAAAYAALSPALAKSFHNEFFEGDADQLLSNSETYLERCVVHNRNAAAVAAYFESVRTSGGSASTAVKQVLYPPHSPGGSKNIDPFLRKPTAEFPAPGYGCLLSVEFDSMETTKAVYEALNFFKGPHLGAQYTICMPYCFMLYGKENTELFASYGLRAEQIRFAVGYEDEEVLVGRCRDAVGQLSS